MQTYEAYHILFWKIVSFIYSLKTAIYCQSYVYYSLHSGLAWIIIPHADLGYFSHSFTYDSWRIFVAVCTIPLDVSTLCILFSPFRFSMDNHSSCRPGLLLRQFYLRQLENICFCVCSIPLDVSKLCISFSPFRFSVDNNSSCRPGLLLPQFYLR